MLETINVICPIAGAFYIAGSFLVSKKEPEKVEYELREEDFKTNPVSEKGVEEGNLVEGVAVLGGITDNGLISGHAVPKGLLATLQNKKFLILFFIAYLVPLYLVYLTSFMKIIFMPIINDDGYLAICSIMLTISGMIGAPFWGIVADHSGFKKTLLLLCLSDLVTKIIGLGCS